MKMSLKIKATAVILMFTLVLSAGLVTVSYTTYTDSFNSHYSTLATSIARAAAATVDANAMESLVESVLSVYRAYCAEKGIPDSTLMTEQEQEEYLAAFSAIPQRKDYQTLLGVLEELCEAHEVESLYLGFTDLQTGKDIYLVDAGKDPCAPGSFDEVQPEHWESIRAGNYEFPAFITDLPEYGYLCSASAPIRNAQGTVIGVALVDISMNKIVSERHGFFVSLALLAAVTAIVCAAIVFYLVNRYMLRPIRSLDSAASEFVQHQKEGNESLSALAIHTGDELESLARSFCKMEADLGTYIAELTAVTSEKERIGAELDIATHIQSSMLPCIFPAFPEREEFDIYAEMTPAKEVGGDFYDFFMVDERHIAVVMADVSGKGVPAALFMVIAKTLIKDHTLPDCDLGEVFTCVNRILCESNSEGLFVTAFEGVLDLVSGEFTFVNAGHEVPYICKKDSGYAPYKIKPGFVLAGFETMKYTAGSLSLSPGDRLFEYTDGVTEATNANGELYGAERLAQALSRTLRMSVSDTVHTIKSDIDAFVGEADPFDDVTMLCLEYKCRMETEEHLS